MSNDERNNEQDFKERKFVIGRQELKKSLFSSEESFNF